ncbi:MAG: hypothetical protein ACFFD4_21360 [Candidatus Odinarchaeota archaeon]
MSYVDEKGTSKRAVPLNYAFLLAIVIPLAIEVVFSIIGAETNPILGQVELILVLLSFCLTGILTRSAKKGLLAVPAGLINYLILFVVPLFWNPYGLFTAVQEPLQSLVTAGLLAPEQLALIGIFLIAADIVVLIILTFFGGLFSGGFSGAGVIGKVITGFFLIVLLLIVPFTYIGVAKGLEGGGYLLATAVEASTILDEMGTDIDEIMQNQTLLDEFNQRLRSTGDNMDKSADALGFVQQNFLLTLVLNLAGYGDLLEVLDIVRAAATFMETTPYLVTGFFSLDKGMLQTFDYLAQAPSGSSTRIPEMNYKIAADYSSEFGEGLKFLEYAVGNFTEAEDGLVEAIQQIKEALQVQSLQNAIDSVNLDEVVAMLDQIGNSIPELFSVGSAATSFINATYEVSLGMEAIGENDFIEAGDWMNSAASHFTVASDILTNINLTDLWQPVVDAVTVFTDMTDVLIDVVSLGANTTTTFVAFEDVFAQMELLNKTHPYKGTPLNQSNDDIWDAIESNLQTGSTALINATTFLSSAETKLGIYGNKSYGTMAPFGAMFSQFSQLISQFSGNITDFAHAAAAASYTFSALKAFSIGINGLRKLDFSDSIRDAFLHAKDNASLAYEELGETSNLNPKTVTTWRSLLMEGDNATFNATLSVQQDIYHMSIFGYDLVVIANAESDLHDFVVTLLETLDFGIFNP